jgi:hypothetical protein
MQVGCLAFTSGSAELTNVVAQRLRTNGHVGAMAKGQNWFGWVLFVLFWVAAPLFFLGWPLLTSTNSAGNSTHHGWIAEHVWIGVLGALLIAASALILLLGRIPGLPGQPHNPPVFASMLALLAWPALTWATGSDYTGYALTRAGWIAGAVWLGVLVAWAVVVFVTS